MDTTCCVKEMPTHCMLWLCRVCAAAAAPLRAPLCLCSKGMPPSTDFARFCQATHAWLAEATSLDPPLAALADLLERGLPERPPGAEDAHTLLGTQALRDLVRCCELADV